MRNLSFHGTAGKLRLPIPYESAVMDGFMQVDLFSWKYFKDYIYHEMLRRVATFGEGNATTAGSFCPRWTVP
jgi:hypothetical protein